MAYEVQGLWTCDEAASGTGPSAALDRIGSSDCVHAYNGELNYTSITEGEGLDYTSTSGDSGSVKEDCSAAGTIGALMDGVQTASLLLVVQLDAGTSSSMRVCQLGTDSGNGEIAITLNTSSIEARFASEGGSNRNVYSYTPAGTLQVLAFIFDSTESTVGDRCKFHINGNATAESPTSASINVNDTLNTQTAGTNWSLGNRGSLNREVDGQIFYAELGTGLLTADQITDSYDALILDNNTDWQASPIIRPPTAMMHANF